MESSDVYVEIEPSDNGLSIQLESVVKKQFGEKIQAVVKEVLEEQGVEIGQTIDSTTFLISKLTPLFYNVTSFKILYY